MFILDSLMIAGLRWALETTITAAEAEMNDDAALREQLMEAEMRREMGEISDDEFEDIEADLLARIREIKERREGSGPLAFGEAQPLETTGDNSFTVEATVSGDFHNPADAPHATVIESTPTSGQQATVMDMEPGDAAPPAPAPPEAIAGHRPRRPASKAGRAAGATAPARGRGKAARRRTGTKLAAASTPKRRGERATPGARGTRRTRTTRRS